jgi:hypothetical protein
MFHHGSNMWTSRIFFRSTPSDTSASRGDDRYQRSIRILCLHICFNICSLDASESTRVYRWWSYISYHSWVTSCWEAGTFCTSIPCLFQRKGHHLEPERIPSKYATEEVFQYLILESIYWCFSEHTFCTLPGIACSLLSSKSDTHCLSLSSTLLLSLWIQS